jgi:hypothetical protein
MRKFIFYHLILTSLSSKGQKLEFGLSAGSGLTYIIENFERGSNMNYGLPMSLITEIKYTPVSSDWGLKIRFHSVQSSVHGQSFTNGGYFYVDGYVKTFSTFLLLENEILKG